MRRHSNCAKRQRNHQRRQEKCCCQRGRPTAPAGAAPAEPRAVRAVPGRSGCPSCIPAHLRPTSAGWSLWAGAGRWSADRQVAADGRGAARRRAELTAGRPPRGSGPGTGREGVRTGPPRHLASVGCSPGRPSAPHAAQGGWGGAEDRAAARQGGIWGRRRVPLRDSRAGGRNYGWSGRP